MHVVLVATASADVAAAAELQLIVAQVARWLHLLERHVALAGSARPRPA